MNFNKIFLKCISEIVNYYKTLQFNMVFVVLFSNILKSTLDTFAIFN